MYKTLSPNNEWIRTVLLGFVWAVMFESPSRWVIWYHFYQIQTMNLIAVFDNFDVSEKNIRPFWKLRKVCCEKLLNFHSLPWKEICCLNKFYFIFVGKSGTRSKVLIVSDTISGLSVIKAKGETLHLTTRFSKKMFQIC